MATIDGRELDLRTPGGVLFLSQPAQRDWAEQLADGITVTTSSSSRAAVVTGLPSSLGIDDVGTEAHRVVNEALDLMAARSLGVYSLTELDSPTVAWVRSAGQVRLRTTSYLHSTFTMTIGGPPNPSPTSWHPSMRYFRLSQSTTDLFDAFRNLYLALESILSTLDPVRIRPDGRSAEREGAWLKRALATAEQHLLTHNPAYHLGRYLTPASPATGAPGVDAVMLDLYASVRTTVFHAKNGRAVALPQHEPDRAAIADALARYSRFYLDLADGVLGARFMSSGIGQAVVDTLANGLMPQWAIGASSETWPTIVDFDQAAAASLVPMNTVRAPEFDGPFTAALRGELDQAAIPSGFVVRSIGARDCNTNEPVTVEALGGDLTLESVYLWEHILTFRARGGGLKVNYVT